MASSSDGDLEICVCDVRKIDLIVRRYSDGVFK